MCRVVTAERVYEWAPAHKPVFIYMAAEMHKLVDQVHGGGCRYKQPSDVRRRNSVQDKYADG